MNKENYQIVMERMISDIKNKEIRPKLLLHSCCGPCSSYVLECLNEVFDITIIYYNPNIYPKAEYERRRDELKCFLKAVPYDIKVIEIEYDDSDFYRAIKGYEKCEERGERCFKCYELRLDKTAKYALDNNFDYFTTTLSISPYKVSDKINEIGRNLEDKYGISYLYADFKKKNGYKRSLELSEKYKLYRQNYCGCVYSYTERIKYENQNSCSREFGN